MKAHTKQYKADMLVEASDYASLKRSLTDILDLLNMQRVVFPRSPPSQIAFMHDKILHHRSMRNGKVSAQMVIPASLSEHLIRSFHCSPIAAHLGLNKTYARMRERFFWEKMYADLKRAIKGCTLCLKRKMHKRHSSGLMTPMLVEGPFHRVCMDIWGGDLPPTSSGAIALINLVDCFTRWPESYPVRDRTAETVSDVLFDYVCRHGVMFELLSDNAPEFTAKVFKLLNTRLGIKKIYSTPYHPRTNASVERFHRPLAAALHILISSENSVKSNWDLFPAPVLFALRTSVIDGIGFSHGRSAVLPEQVLFGSIPVFQEDARLHGLQLPKIMRIAFDAVKASQLQQSAKNKRLFDRSRQPASFSIGSLVLVYHDALSERLNSKFEDRAKGPFRISKKLSDNVYRIEPVDGLTPHSDTLRLRSSVNVSNLQRFTPSMLSTPPSNPKLAKDASTAPIARSKLAGTSLSSNPKLVKDASTAPIPTATVRPFSSVLPDAAHSPLPLDAAMIPHSASRPRLSSSVFGLQAPTKRARRSAQPASPFSLPLSPIAESIEPTLDPLPRSSDRYPKRARTIVPLYDPRTGLDHGFYVDVSGTRTFHYHLRGKCVTVR